MINVGSIDRALRLLLGVILMVAPFLLLLGDSLAELSTLKYGMLGVGVVLFGTAILRFCPAYALFGIRTCQIKQP
jgi:hypothetical protein